MPNEDPSKDYELFEVEWQKDAAILDNMFQVQDALVEADYETGQFVLDSSLPGLADVRAGQPLLLGGIGVFRVTDVTVEGENTRLTVEVALLTDIIEDGRIEWRRSFVSAEENRKIGLGIEENEADSITALRQDLSGEYKDGELKFSGKIGDFETSFSVKHAYPKLEMTLESKATSGPAVINAVAKGSLTGLTSEANVEITSGELTNFSVKFLDVEGEVEVEAGAAQISLPASKIVIPGRLSLPIVLGGIPFRVDLGGSLEWESTLKANASARFKGKTTFKGGVGVNVKDGKASPLATFTHSTATTLESTQVGTIKAGLGLVVNFPELSVGVGVPKIAMAGVAFKFKSELLTNVEFKYEAAGPVPVITDFCLITKTNFGATLEKEVSLLGFTFKDVGETTPLFAEFGPQKKSGGACE